MKETKIEPEEKDNTPYMGTWPALGNLAATIEKNPVRALGEILGMLADAAQDGYSETDVRVEGDMLWASVEGREVAVSPEIMKLLAAALLAAAPIVAHWNQVDEGEPS